MGTSKGVGVMRANILDQLIIVLYNDNMNNVIEKFDLYLTQHHLQFQTVIIGGAALIAMEVINRKTKDIDCLFPEIPVEIKQASREFAAENPDLDLMDSWLNNGPASLVNDRPEGWQDGVVTIFTGSSIVLQTLGRVDLLRTKLYAPCDRQEDWPDCIALAPTAEELSKCLAWVAERDGNPYWPEHVKNTFTEVAERIGYAYRPSH